jgi:hypothetical protein
MEWAPLLEPVYFLLRTLLHWPRQLEGLPLAGETESMTLDKQHFLEGIIIIWPIELVTMVICH